MIFKYKKLKDRISNKLLNNYTSKCDLLYQFKVYEVIKFLNRLTKEFVYEGFYYDQLPMFYEVVQSTHDRL